MERLPISVIIITKNAGRTLADCLSSVRGNNPAEIIIVDGESTDGTVAIARRYTEKVFSDDGKGKAYARQLGAEQAREEYIAYIDSDVILTDGALATMLAELQNSDCISMRAQVAPDMKCASYWERAQHQQQLFTSKRHHLGMMTCLLRREAVLRYGFDPSAGGLDDTVLEFKLRKEGHKFGISSALVYHHWEPDLKSVVKYRFFLGRLEARAIRRYGPWHAGFWPPLGTLYWLVFSVIKGMPGLIPYIIVDGTVKTAGVVKGFFELMGEAVRRR